LAEAGVDCSAIRHQLRIDLWQRFAGAGRLWRPLHDGVDAVHPQACPLASRASSESRTLAGGRDLSARPLIAGYHGTKRYGQADTEHAERADRDHVAHHRRPGLKWIRTGHPLSRRSTQWFMSIAQGAECMQSAIGEEARSPRPRIAQTSWRSTGHSRARPQSVRLSGCDAGPTRIAGRADNRRRATQARKVRLDERRANSWIRFPLGPDVRGDMTVLAMRALTSAVDSPRGKH